MEHESWHSLTFSPLSTSRSGWGSALIHQYGCLWSLSYHSRHQWSGANATECVWMKLCCVSLNPFFWPRLQRLWHEEHKVTIFCSLVATLEYYAVRNCVASSLKRTMVTVARLSWLFYYPSTNDSHVFHEKSWANDVKPNYLQRSNKKQTCKASF